MKKTKQKPVRVLITGGPTRAYLDAVRFLSNSSTGGVAYHTAEALLQQGCEVSAVCGPTELPFSQLGLKYFVPVLTHREMMEQVRRLCRSFRPHYVVFAAAVLDFEPARRRAGKVSSTEKGWSILLRPTPKIIDAVGREFPKIKRIGFKLETKSPGEKATLSFALETMEQKQLDALCLNFLNEIKSETEHPALFATRDGSLHFLNGKREIARAIAGHIEASARSV